MLEVQKLLKAGATPADLTRDFAIKVVTHPATSSSSLIATGTPCSGPTGSPAARAASRRAASARAESASTTENAFNPGSRLAIRSSEASTASDAVDSPEAMRRASSAAERSARVVMATT